MEIGKEEEGGREEGGREGWREGWREGGREREVGGGVQYTQTSFRQHGGKKLSSDATSLPHLALLAVGEVWNHT